MKRSCLFLLILAGTMAFQNSAFSQSALSQLEHMAGSSVNVPMPSNPVPVGGVLGSVAKSGSALSSGSLSDAVAGMVIQGLINNLLSPTPSKTPEEIEAERIEQERLAMEAEKQRLEEEARQQALHDKLINDSKSISDLESLDFKSLDGDMENLRKEAADQFEPKGTGGSAYPTTMGTQFFGTPLAEPEVKILLEPENAPVKVDLEKSVELTDEYLDKEKAVVKIIGGAVVEALGEPIVEKPDCKALSEKLTRYRNDMVRFRSWNSTTLTELNKWEKQNDEALWNAISDGAEAAYGVFLDYIQEARSGASVIKNVFEANEAAYIKKGLITQEQALKYKNLLDLRIKTASLAGKISTGFDIKDYVTTARNIIHGTTEKLAATDGECNNIIRLLKDNGLLSDTPWVDAGQFLAGTVIDTFLEDPTKFIKPGTFTKAIGKLPYVTISQLAVNEAYNITDMLTSYSNVCTLREADGKAAEAVRKIQSDMDSIKTQMSGCPTSF